MLDHQLVSRIALLTFVWFGCLSAWADRRVRRCIDQEKLAAFDDLQKVWYRTWPKKEFLKQEGLLAYYVRYWALAASLACFIVFVTS
jgi:hypothetical protein